MQIGRHCRVCWISSRWGCCGTLRLQSVCQSLQSAGELCWQVAIALDLPMILQKFFRGIQKWRQGLTWQSFFRCLPDSFVQAQVAKEHCHVAVSYVACAFLLGINLGILLGANKTSGRESSPQRPEHCSPRRGPAVAAEMTGPDAFAARLIPSWLHTPRQS